MRPVLTKITPKHGFSTFLHYVIVGLVPFLMFVLIRLEFFVLALLVIVLAKWRMFAVRPRFWPANIRANAVDIMFGVSMLVFMQNTDSPGMQLIWAGLYGVWLVFLKPRSGVLWVSIQAGIAQFVALTALYLTWDNMPIWLLSLATGVICYWAARHFIDSFDEVYARLLSYIWGYFGAALAWLTAHWLLYYQFLAQPTLLLSAIGYSLAALYYFDHVERLSPLIKRQLIAIMAAVVFVVLVFSDWYDKVV